jgi:hypothetical protein
MRVGHTLWGGLVFVIAAAGHVPAASAPNYMPMDVGRWWRLHTTTDGGHLSQTTLKVTAFDKAKGLYTVEVITPSNIIDNTYSVDDDALHWRSEEFVGQNLAVDFKPMRKTLSLALRPGDSWGWTGLGMMDVPITENSTVQGSEAVNVQAGHFNTRHVHTVLLQGVATATGDYWYANGVGMVKSVSTSGNDIAVTELVAYGQHK